jgi:hypothetical protein
MTSETFDDLNCGEFSNYAKSTFTVEIQYAPSMLQKQTISADIYLVVSCTFCNLLTDPFVAQGKQKGTGHSLVEV